MMFLGIDTSFSSTGYALRNKGSTSPFVFGTINTKPKDGCYSKRCEIIGHALVSAVNDYKPDYVGIEMYAYASKGMASKDLAGLYHVVKVLLVKETHLTYDHILSCTPTNLKKFHTGNGKADKDLMVKHLPDGVKKTFTELYKKSNGLYDVTDAYALSQWIEREIER